MRLTEFEQKSNREDNLSEEDLRVLLDKLTKAAERVKESAFRVELQSPTGFLDDNLQSVDVLIMRFTRLAYMLIAKAIPLIDLLDGLASIDIISSLARAESRGLLENSERLFALPIVRNEFSDDYEAYEPELIVSELIALTPSLLNSVERTRMRGILLMEQAH